ncbi:hypothetical protein BC826DRAFT_194276 [Russula brevipes]|nr:hypothetical protein BC826DRAFT_194276 [Russula brevipes]
MRSQRISAAIITTKWRCCSCLVRHVSRPVVRSQWRRYVLPWMPAIGQMRCASPCPRPVAAHHGLFKDSTIGIVTSPGMTTGAILSRANVEQAARLPIIITFMTSASTRSALVHPRDPVCHLCVSTRGITSMATALPATWRGMHCSVLAVAPSGPSSALRGVQTFRCPFYSIADTA